MARIHPCSSISEVDEVKVCPVKVISAPPLQKNTNLNDERPVWHHYIWYKLITWGLPLFFGFFWGMLRDAELKTKRRQQNNEDDVPHLSPILGWVFRFMFLPVFLSLQIEECVRNKYWRAKHNLYYVDSNIRLSAFLCCSSLFIVGISAWLLYAVPEMVILAYDAKEATDIASVSTILMWTICCVPFSHGFVTNLSMALVWGHKTYHQYISTRRRQLQQTTAANLPL